MQCIYVLRFVDIDVFEFQFFWMNTWNLLV